MRLIDAEHMGSDNDIIKALEHCASGTTNEVCCGCPFHDKAICLEVENGLQIYSLDLIKRLKAEIERLETELKAMRGAANSLKMHLRTARTESIKEFADRLKQTRVDLDGIEMVAVGNIDTIEKEMTEE